jgi:hypothetical protein
MEFKNLFLSGTYHKEEGKRGRKKEKKGEERHSGGFFFLLLLSGQGKGQQGERVVARASRAA